MFAPPRIWEGLNATVQVKIMDTTPLKRFLYERLMPIGYKVADLRLERGRRAAALAHPPPLRRLAALPRR